LAIKEQDEVWRFFSDMLITERLQEAIDLWKWSTAHPDRVRLQHALQGALKQAGRDPEIPQTPSLTP
jgi:hypothetical protein